ncbi:MAG: hypothetical protein ABIG43_05405 [Chloroflexota bacterium]
MFDERVRFFEIDNPAADTFYKAPMRKNPISGRIGSWDSFFWGISIALLNKEKTGTKLLE